MAARSPKGQAYRGRPPSIKADDVRRLKDEEGLGASPIAERLGIARASVYRVLKSRRRLPERPWRTSTIPYEIT